MVTTPTSGDGGAALEAARRAFRDAAIVAGVKAGREKRQLAKDYGITPRQVARILEAWNVAPSVIDQPALDVLRDMLVGYDHLEHHFVLLAQTSLESYPAVASSALKGIADVKAKRQELLMAVGKLPRELEVFPALAELDRLLADMVKLTLMVESGERTPAELARFLIDEIEGRRPLPAGAIEAETAPTDT